MTRRQRIYLVWLVIHNLERIVRRCSGTRQASRIIESAYRRRVALGLPAWVGHMDTTRQLDEIHKAFARLTDHRPDLDDPIGD